MKKVSLYKKPPLMKNVLFAFLLLSSSLFAQQINKKWGKVIVLENEGKIKSANEIVSEIYKQAVSEKNEVQIIKCFFYQSKYLMVVDENAQNKVLNNLRSEINRVSIPSKAILNFVYAKCLNDYYNRNAYKIQRRTNTAFLDEDFLTWTEANLDTWLQGPAKMVPGSTMVLAPAPAPDVRKNIIAYMATLKK